MKKATIDLCLDILMDLGLSKDVAEKYLNDLKKRAQARVQNRSS